MSELSTQDSASLSRNKVNLEKLTVLIVDPNEFSRNFTRSLCRKFKFGMILTAVDTKEAMALLESHRVDLIICEWMLAPLPLVEFAKKIRCSHMSNSALPIIILTADGRPESIKASRDAGVNDFLTRPVVVRRFLDSLLSVLRFPPPYVKSANYTGPCRRRKQLPFIGVDRRGTGLSYVGKSSNLAEIAAKASEGGGTSLEEMEKAGEATVEEEAEKYIKVRLYDIAELFDLVRQLKHPDAPMKDILDRIFVKSNDVKGMGETFGFPLLTRLGGLLCEFVQDTDPESFKTLTRLQALESQVIVMKMVVDSDIRDEGDELAKELMEELRVMVDKFKHT